MESIILLVRDLLLIILPLVLSYLAIVYNFTCNSFLVHYLMLLLVVLHFTLKLLVLIDQVVDSLLEFLVFSSGLIQVV